MARTINLGIIGTGLAVEKLHWPALRRLGNRYEVVAFTNRSREKAEHFAQYSGTPIDRFVDSTDALLANDHVEAVLISLPIELNYPTTLAALEAGKHVICEKPAGATEPESRAFVELVNRFPNQLILVAENWFYRDDLRFARSLIDAGVLGDIHLISWRAVSQLIPRDGEFSSTPWRHHAQYDGGPHLDAGVHHTAQIRLLGGDVYRLHGETQDANSTHSGPSDLTLNLRFKSGAIGSYTASYPELAVIGESNAMAIYGSEGQLVVGRNEITLARGDGKLTRYRITQQDGGYYNEFLNFHEALTASEPLIGTVVQSFRNSEIILKGIESARKGQVISFGDLPEPLSADAVPLWKPRDADGPFDGLDVTIDEETVTVS